MENKVIMSLKDYNALKRKADALESAVSLKSYGTWVECMVDARAIKPYVMAQLDDMLNDGAFGEDTVKVRPTHEWYGGITVADILKKEE